MATTAHGRRHGRSCYWDHLRCGWVCADPPAEPSVADGDAGLDRAVDGAVDAATGRATPRVPAEPLPV
jgi:hypothetical protein